MKVNELRIGNVLKEKYSGDLLIVIELTKQRITFDYQTTEKWQSEPIELTEEILLKCGFVKDEFDNWENETRLGLYKPEEFDGYLSIWGDSTVGECNYLHQLQNLYFALTGQELEINL